ncbi:MAG: fatty acid desaturase [Oculatellaceae cyanobacterium Prado106]|nr:fatty acid desaturase [Oculatellaceae cyanobacterium Prado106]
MALLAPWFFSWSAVGIAVFLNWFIGSVGVCMGYHRLLTHRSFSVPKPLERAIAIIASLALQGGPIFWVANHRRHHLHTEDLVNDPYSASKGFWWSHMGWLLRMEADTWDYERYRKFAPDLDRDPLYRWLDRYIILLLIPFGVILYLLGGWSFVIYGIFVRNVIEWHGTWLINSACHLLGYRNYDNTGDNSRNLWWAAVFTYGEGWHNNHHAFPNSAKAGMKWWEVDMTWWSIWVLSKLGLAQRVVLPAIDAPSESIQQ